MKGERGTVSGGIIEAEQSMNIVKPATVWKLSGDKMGDRAQEQINHIEDSLQILVRHPKIQLSCVN